MNRKNSVRLTLGIGFATAKNVMELVEQVVREVGIRLAGVDRMVSCFVKTGSLIG